MKEKNMRKRITAKKIRAVIVMVCLIAIACAKIAYAATDEGTSDSRKLLNGSFEEGQNFTGNYLQPNQSAVPSWNTTAFQGKIELFRKNTGTYINGVILEPTDGTYAAELNADEESTLYQNVKTSPSSVYEWGLDHGGRNGKDIMALVIGPKQSVDPSKPRKDGRDQFMQMVDWLNIDVSTITAGAEPTQYTVYSKKFAEKGTFADNAGNNAFSLTPSSIYTEKWQIWIMASSRATSGMNPWNSYGSNAEDSASSGNGSGNTTVDLSKYYLYTVPAGQTDTIFGFVSVGYVDSIAPPDKAKTYGNFLDNIYFKIYHPLSGSTSNHGSAVVGGSDGTSGGTGATKGHQITIDNKLSTFVTDGEPLKIQAVVKKADVDDGCEFVGVYHTEHDENGNLKTEFLKLAENVIDDTGSLTEEEKAGKWLKTTNADGDIIYTYYLGNITSATDLHFVFIKSPTVTYDPNGGKEYIVARTYNTDEATNVYSFKPASNHNEAQANTATIFIDPYVSQAAEGQNDGWKFLGWKLTGDIFENSSGITQINPEQLGSLILPAEHTIACDYAFDGVNGDSKAQYFKIYDGNVSLTKAIVKNDLEEDTGVTWNDNGETVTYANVHKGLTMIAQWRWLQAFIPQVHNAANDTYIASNVGGTVEITSVTDTSDENYNAAYNENGGKSYHAKTDEKIIVKATANENYTFEGWYDESGDLITTNAEYAYVEAKESVTTYYARFSNTVTQTYIRQIKSGGSWMDTTDDNIGMLDRYTYTDAVGKPISSTATAGKGYKFVGWYDSEGNKVADSVLTNSGTTLRYTTTGDATYYARFETTYTLTVSKIDGDSSTTYNKVPLAGAEFTLYQKDDSGDKTIVYGGESIKCTAVETGVTALSGNGAKATVVFRDKLVSEKDYYLVETKAPAGYRLIDTPLKITIDVSGDNVLIDGTLNAINNKEVNVELMNYLLLYLPMSGSSATGGWFVAGLVLLTAAVISLYCLKRNRFKKANPNKKKLKAKRLTAFLFSLIVGISILSIEALADNRKATENATISTTLLNAANGRESSSITQQLSMKD